MVLKQRYFGDKKSFFIFVDALHFALLVWSIYQFMLVVYPTLLEQLEEKSR